MHGRIESSNIKVMALPSGRAKPVATGLSRYFPWIVSVLVFTGSLSGAAYIYLTAQNGAFAWSPYPLFALFVLGVFAIYSRICQED